MPHASPPSASAPSFSPGGACENTSRMTAVQIGTIISATTMPAMNVDAAEQRGLRLEDRDEPEVRAQASR